VATNLSGPRRPYTGAVRDFVLGTRIVSGIGEDLSFGGRVIKNVAGYDVSRLMCGAMGTLGVLLDVSFKVLPRPADEVTLRFAFDEPTAIRRFNEWAGQPLPLSAAAWHDGVAYLRLSGTVAGVRAAVQKLGGERVEDGAQLWRDINDQRHGFFAGDAPLWRLSVPSTIAPLELGMPQWIDWGGALRWVRGPADTAALRAKVAAAGGHVTLFRGGDKSAGVFHPLDAVLARIHRNLKNAFDPHGILNPGRMDNF
jgi:glycolate oxidase FAD binding subunit